MRRLEKGTKDLDDLAFLFFKRPLKVVKSQFDFILNALLLSLELLDFHFVNKSFRLKLPFELVESFSIVNVRFEDVLDVV